jgi:hypothetical protein
MDISEMLLLFAQRNLNPGELRLNQNRIRCERFREYHEKRRAQQNYWAKAQPGREHRTKGVAKKIFQAVRPWEDRGSLCTFGESGLLSHKPSVNAAFGGEFPTSETI